VSVYTYISHHSGSKSCKILEVSERGPLNYSVLPLAPFLGGNL